MENSKRGEQPAAWLTISKKNTMLMNFAVLLLIKAIIVMASYSRIGVNALFVQNRGVGKLRSVTRRIQTVQLRATSSADQHGKPLQDMKVAELKNKIKELGGKPGSLNKTGLINVCEALLNGATISLSSTKDIGDINTSFLPPEPIKQQSMVSRTISSAAARYVLTNMGSLTMTEEDKATRYPIGAFRDHRLPRNVSGEMELHFLGTASCVPTVTRGVSSLTLRYKGDIWMFDCGEATQVQIQSSRIKPSKISKIFITHMHGDHVFGLPGILCLLGKSTMDERGLPEKDCSNAISPIDIYGPEGIREYIRAAMQLSYSRITAPYRVHELKNVPFLNSKSSRLAPPSPVKSTKADPVFGERPGGRDIFPDANGIYNVVGEEEGELTVRAAAIQHTIPCVGYVVTEKDRQGSMNIESLQEIVDRNKVALSKDPAFESHHRKVYAYLKNLPPWESYTFPDGTVVYSKDFNSPPRKGRKVVILGDTCNSDRLVSIAQNADMLVHEATNAWLEDFDKFKYPTPAHLEKDTYFHGHSTPQMAGRFCTKINAKRLILTHFSPRYQGDASESSMKNMWRIEDLARKASELKADNDVIAAWDFMSIFV